MVTFIGVAFFGVPALRSTSTRDKRTTVTLTSGFAAGAILSTTFFLMLPESFTLVSHVQDETHDNHRRLRRVDGEHEAAWQWSLMVLAGFCVVLALDLFLAVVTSCNESVVVMKGTVDMFSIQEVNMGTPTREAAPAEEAAPTGCAILFNDPAYFTNGSVQRVLFATLVGDALLNFSDGVFIATAFQTCSPAAGWVVVIGTVAKELAQELADFLVLATVCGLNPAVALALNFATGITVTLGVIVVLAAGLSERAVGLLLAFGSGLYLHNAAVEYMPRLVGEPDLRTKSISAALFTFGAVAIGLVLLGQTDCEVHL